MTLTLENGSRVAVIGGGPAGSLFAYFLLTFVQRMDLEVGVDIYEPRDFTRAGPSGCNMCGGIVSETLVQALAVEGIELPPTVVQRGIDSYVLHTRTGSVKIATPLRERRIAAVHRGGGPRDLEVLRWGGLDGYLLKLAQGQGAQVIATKITDAGWDNDRPYVRVHGETRSYDLLVGATGVNSTGWQLFEKLGLRSTRVETTRAYVTELRLGLETITQHFGNSMHLFLLNLSRLDCAAIIPKGDYVTVCLLGRDVDDELIARFFQEPAVRRCFPESWSPTQGACHCAPRMNIREASQPFMDRVVLIGDCGVTRLYKDGIGAAFRTAKAAARTAVFSGVSADDFRRHYWPLYRSIARDNRYGFLLFAVMHRIKALEALLKGVLRTTAAEQTGGNGARRMSLVLLDMFTGSAPYRDIFFRTLAPGFVAEFLTGIVQAAVGGPREGMVN
ncbi:MAG TPA: hypothetical protein VJ206_07965 [bacterium]|nr:hypothetical protein [bacterium]